MAKGDGSIIARGRGVWEVQLSFGKDPITGKYRKATRTVHGTKAEARKVRDQLRRELESGLSIEGEKLTFGEFAKVWSDNRAASGAVGAATIAKDAYTIKLLVRYLGGVKLRDIDAQAIESLYTRIRADKAGEGRSFGGTSMRNVHQLLRQIMQKAVDYDLILRNPCDRVKAPKADDPERRSLSVDEGTRLLACIDDAELKAYAAIAGKEARQTERGNLFGRSYLRGLNVVSSVLAVRIGLATGMRRGEVFGLCWGEVDLERGSIKVLQSLTSDGDLKQPKSKAGIRTIAIDKATAEHLAEWKKRQAVELLKLGIKQDDTAPVCCSEKGGFIDLHNFERWWRRFRDDCGFGSLKFHELRHTQATQLFANGVDVKTVQTRLGHSNASLTLNWYAHAVPENDGKAAQLVGELFAGKPEEPRIIEVKTA